MSLAPLLYVKTRTSQSWGLDKTVVNVGVSEQSVRNWVKRFKDDGGVELLSAKPWPGTSQKISVHSTVLKR
ncbi:hypothetical protein E2C01_030273 [Portunus trituberculatus]|uniref:Uncharacterized protein n=1 Tax=Portunus trituberculatus TaxID=210409 RepID=A0A5B7EUB7_PORTR|nr:hypothetical protein [Portunus trituberculatus]